VAISEATNSCKEGFFWNFIFTRCITLWYLPVN